MSAILGLISETKDIDDAFISRVRSKYLDYKIDRFDNVRSDKMYFECGHQYFALEAEKDVSPIYDAGSGVYFLADCYLYNRESVIKDLAEDDALKLVDKGDAELSYLAYLKYGEMFVERISGSFAISVYDEKSGILRLYADPVAQRFLAYSFTGGKVVFASTFGPILEAIGANVKLNSKWISAAYMDCTADTIKIGGKTPYEGIFCVEAGCEVVIDTQIMKVIGKTRYFDPRKNSEILDHDDEKIKKLFIETFTKTTEDMLHNRGEVGIKLSGGLDSSSIAALSSRKLKREGKSLYSFTQVPCKDFNFENSRYTMQDESDMIRIQEKAYGNLIPSFVSVDGTNAIDNARKFGRFFEEPVKPILNMGNIDGMVEEAVNKGCKILLSGQNGNATISYGFIFSCVYQKFEKLKIKAALQNLSKFCSYHKVSRKYLAKLFIKTFFEEKLKKWVPGEDCFIKDDFIKQYKLASIVNRISKKQGTGYIDSREQRVNFGYMPLVFQHMGYYDTYTSLIYGILPLDPTLSREMIELCISLPIECNVRNGRDRCTVRDYMKGLVPDEILENFSTRGSQAADFAYRVNRDWSRIREEALNLLKTPELLDYFDEKKYTAFVEKIEKSTEEFTADDVAMMAVTASLGAFLQDFYKEHPIKAKH